MGKSKDLATGNSAFYQDQTESDTRYVNVSGDTMTGALTINRTTSGTNLNVVVPDGQRFNQVDFKNGTSQKGAIWTDEQTDLMGYYTPSNWGMNFYTGGTERMKIDSSGRVTMPNQPSFGAYNATGNNAADITFANTFFNIGNHFVASTGIFTCPVAGRYLFTWNALHGQSPTSYARVLFKINGSTSTLYGDSLTSDGNGIYVKTSIDGIFNLSANDTVRLYNEGNTIYGTQYAMFSGCLLG